MGLAYSTTDVNMIGNKERNYEYLVLSGGGIKGFCYPGALEVLEREKILQNIKGFAGTSIGAFVASLLAVGFTAKELRERFIKMNIADLFEYTTWHIKDAYTLYEYYGLNQGDKIYNLLGEMIKEKTGDADYTIKKLYDEKNIKLVLVGTNVNTFKTVYFYPESKIEAHANVPIRMAVRISICIPILFKPVKYENDYYVDGGVLDNYPLHVFDGEYPGDYKARLNINEINKKVLGLRIIQDSEEIDYSRVKREEIPNFQGYCMSLINTFLYENDRRIMTPTFCTRTVNIVTPTYSMTDFNLTEKQKEELIKVGMECTEKFLKA